MKFRNLNEIYILYIYLVAFFLQMREACGITILSACIYQVLSQWLNFQENFLFIT
jgi:hypothetical protein